MISGVGKNDQSLMQLLLSAMKNSSGLSNASGVSKDDLGSVTSVGGKEDEFLDCLKSNFDKIDADSDSQLSFDEIASYTKDNRPMGPPPGMFIENMDVYSNTQSKETQDTSVASSKGEAASTKSVNSFEQTFDELDTNKDGKVSQEELEAVLSNKTLDSAQSSENKLSDVFSSILDKIDGPGNSKNILEQITKKLSQAYGSQGVSSLLSSAVDLAI